MTKTYLVLLVAIIAEVIATTSLKASAQFTRFWPSVLVVLGYGLAIYLLSVSVRTMPTGIVYAIWSGLGIVLVGVIGLFMGQKLDLPAVAGMALIIAGILVINLFSATAGH
jgi:small multidrug resistance pump